MATLTIEFDDSYDLSAALRGIAGDIEDGAGRGEYPTWYINEDAL